MRPGGDLAHRRQVEGVRLQPDPTDAARNRPAAGLWSRQGSWRSRLDRSGASQGALGPRCAASVHPACRQRPDLLASAPTTRPAHARAGHCDRL